MVFVSALSAPVARATLTCACSCDKNEDGKFAAVCLSNEQMLKYLRHVEMEPDKMGNHTNVKGVAVFKVAFDQQGRVDCAEMLSGHPIAVSLLNASMRKWRFRRFLQNGSPTRACGRLILKYSIVEGQSSVEAVAHE